MSLNNEYAKLMNAGTKNLVDNATFHKATATVTFDASKLELPKGITADSLQTHVTFINDTSGQLRNAVAEIARSEHAKNDKLTTLDGALDFGGVTWNSAHHLKQNLGEDNFIYGGSTTTIAYAHSQDHADYLADQDKVNVDMATKLFG